MVSNEKLITQNRHLCEFFTIVWRLVTFRFGTTADPPCVCVCLSVRVHFGLSGKCQTAMTERAPLHILFEYTQRKERQVLQIDAMCKQANK